MMLASLDKTIAGIRETSSLEVDDREVIGTQFTN
jgi:hypothetical protein